MKVAFDPTVSFKANLIEEAKRNVEENPVQRQKAVIVPISNSLPEKKPISDEEMDKNIREFHEALKDGANIETVITSKHWEKTYIPGVNQVHAKIPGCYDGLEYTIYSNGKVVSQSGWGQPKVVRESDEKLAKYVEQMKNGTISEAATFSKEQKALTNDEIDEKIANFKEKLKNKKWEKTYLPESDMIYIKEQKAKNGLEYSIDKEGTVKEVGLRVTPTVIMNPNKEMADYFNTIKGKSAAEPKKDKPGNIITRPIAAIWKFFSVTGSMTMATAKGLVYGAGAGVGILGSAALLKLISNPKNYKEILSHPVKAAGKTGKIIAGTAAALLLVSNIVAGKLQANEDTAVIEHKMKTGHRDD